MDKALFLSAAFAAVLVSCNTEDPLQDSFGENHTLEDSKNAISYRKANDILIINSLDELGTIFSDSVETKHQNAISLESIDAVYGATKHVEHGYHTLGIRDNRENEKTAFIADYPEYGIYKGTVYIVDFCKATYRITLKDGEYFGMVDSPDCGFFPDGKEGYGYTSSKSGNEILLTTNLTHVKYDLSGRNIDVWMPRKPDDLVWIYGIFTFD